MKIGFLAMSGVRVCDRELLELGLTLPGFVERSKVIASLPSLGLLYLAAVTPKHHQLKYFEAEADGKEPPEIYDCDLVAISTFSAQALEAYNIATRLRQHGVTVAMGGLHVSSLPGEAQKYVDHVIVGEGEHVWPHVVRAVEKREPGRIWRAKDYKSVDLNWLPVPRYELLLDRPYNRLTVQTSRGCPWRCEFCASTVMLAERYRKRPVTGVIRDITRIKQLYPKPFIEFADDNTFVDKRWGRALCRELIPLGLKWFTETDISVVEDKELLQLMSEAGCRQVLIGLESPTKSALEGLETRANFKANAFSCYRKAIEIIQSYGITVNGCFILGLDNHTPDVFEEVLKFANACGLYDVQITVLTPFPGTPLYSRLRAENRLLHDGAWNRCTLFDVNFVPKQMSVRELEQGLYWLTKNLYETEAVEERRKIFHAQLKRPTNNVGLRVTSEGRAA